MYIIIFQALNEVMNLQENWFTEIILKHQQKLKCAQSVTLKSGFCNCPLIMSLKQWFLHVIVKWFIGYCMSLTGGFWIWYSLLRGWVGFTYHCLVVEWFWQVIVLWLSGFYMSLFSGWVVFTCNCFVVEWFLHAIV